MAVTIIEAIQNVLMNDSELGGLGLSSYNGDLAVIISDPVPEDVSEPFIWILDANSGISRDTKITNGSDESYTISAYDVETGSIAQIKSIIDRARKILHRNVSGVTADGLSTIVVDAGIPLDAPTSAEYVGRTFNLRVLTQEN